VHRGRDLEDVVAEEEDIEDVAGDSLRTLHITVGDIFFYFLK
jgi:hypothetical protein